MANLFVRTYTFVDGTTAYGSQVEAEVGNIVTVLNNLNTAATNWGQVSALHATSVPLIADCSNGSQHIADFKNNSVIKASFSSAGLLTAVGATMSAAVAMGANKITGLANGTASTDAAAFGQLKYFQTVQATGTTTTSTSSGTFVDTVVSGAITPTSSSHRIKITISTSIRTSAGRAHYGVGRGGSNISEQGEENISATNETPLCICWIDSPATTSATTYTLQVRQETAGTIDVNVNNLTWCVILEEIV